VAKAAALMAAAAQKGARGEISPRTPPKNGPRTKPPLKAAPTRPKALALAAGSVTSAT
jgi:hypothetical protein